MLAVSNHNFIISLLLPDGGIIVPIGNPSAGNKKIHLLYALFLLLFVCYYRRWRKSTMDEGGSINPLPVKADAEITAFFFSF